MKAKNSDDSNDGMDVLRFYGMLARHPVAVVTAGAMVVTMLGVALALVGRLLPERRDFSAKSEAEAVCRVSRAERTRDCADRGDVMLVELVVLATPPNGENDCDVRFAVQRAVEKAVRDAKLPPARAPVLAPTDAIALAMPTR